MISVRSCRVLKLLISQSYLRGRPSQFALVNQIAHFTSKLEAANMVPLVATLILKESISVIPTIYPQRPGELECDFSLAWLFNHLYDCSLFMGFFHVLLRMQFYMKTGQCKFGERCKFHHPIDRSAPTSVLKQTPQQTVKLTLAGLPRREVLCWNH
ncbi:hypothetical protein B296_00030110 [Ensete ventricosum]|uniref:C3H1-type domain-containing protein n=1 Tax=Ensete ventricosum TaxID=4639 RepID=A0A427A9G1_ENSVE|nr:hypothetical protein B296_00030110 [Ensete ventricosum]